MNTNIKFDSFLDTLSQMRAKVFVVERQNVITSLLRELKRQQGNQRVLLLDSVDMLEEAVDIEDYSKVIFVSRLPELLDANDTLLSVLSNLIRSGSKCVILCSSSSEFESRLRRIWDSFRDDHLPQELNEDVIEQIFTNERVEEFQSLTDAKQLENIIEDTELTPPDAINSSIELENNEDLLEKLESDFKEKIKIVDLSKIELNLINRAFFLDDSKLLFLKDISYGKLKVRSAFVVAPFSSGKTTIAKTLQSELNTENELHVEYIGKQDCHHNDSPHQPTFKKAFDNAVSRLSEDKRTRTHGVFIIDDFDWMYAQFNKSNTFHDTFYNCPLHDDKDVHFVLFSTLSKSMFVDYLDSNLLARHEIASLTLYGFEADKTIEDKYSQSVAFIDDLIAQANFPTEIMMFRHKRLIARLADHYPYYILVLLQRFLEFNQANSNNKLVVPPFFDLLSGFAKHRYQESAIYTEIQSNRAKVANLSAIQSYQQIISSLDLSSQHTVAEQIEQHLGGIGGNATVKNVTKLLVEMGVLRKSLITDLDNPPIESVTRPLLFGYWQRTCIDVMLLQVAYILARQKHLPYHWFENSDATEFLLASRSIADDLQCEFHILDIYECLKERGEFEKVPYLWLSWQQRVDVELRKPLLVNLEENKGEIKLHG